MRFILRSILQSIFLGCVLVTTISAGAQGSASGASVSKSTLVTPSVDGKSVAELAMWRKETEARLKKNWLTVVALDWLKEGDNTVGSSDIMKVRLPKVAPLELGKIRLQKAGKAEIEFTVAKNVTLNGQPVTENRSYLLLTDKSEKRSVVKVGKGSSAIEFYLIERPNGVGVRVKDPNSETLKNFKGLNWFEAKPELVITGIWKDFAQPRVLRVPDILGNSYDESITGSVNFKINGQNYELFPTRKDDELFFVFKDLSSGKETYGTGRFLEAKVEKDNRVVLDFNKAYNPPCGQIKFATCPMPPPENKLNVSVLAGEQSPSIKH